MYMRETKEDRTLISHQPQGKGRKDSFIGKSGKQGLNKIHTSFSVNLLNAGMSSPLVAKGHAFHGVSRV